MQSYETRRTTLDPSDMMGLVERFPDDCLRAWESAAAWSVPALPAKHLLLLGMGGSAIGADLLRAYLEPSATIPITVCRDYEVPAFVDADTVCIAISYSGNTEETLSAYADARRRGARGLAISTGGKLQARAAADGVPCFPLAPGLPPRASLPWSFFSLLRVVAGLGIWVEQDAAVRALHARLREAAARWGPAAADSPALALANSLQDSVPIVYGAGRGLPTVAYRWKCQINENPKMAAACAALPEANHNEQAGFSSPHPEADYARLAVVMLTDPAARVEVRNRARVTADYLRGRMPVYEVEAEGDTLLERMLLLILLGDFVSVYLAWVREIDPTPVEAIEWLKGRLAALRGE